MVAIEALKRAYVERQSGRFDVGEHHRSLALGARMTVDFVRCKAEQGIGRGHMIILDQLGAIGSWSPMQTRESLATMRKTTALHAAALVKTAHRCRVETQRSCISIPKIGPGCFRRASPRL